MRPCPDTLLCAVSPCAGHRVEPLNSESLGEAGSGEHQWLKGLRPHELLLAQGWLGTVLGMWGRVMFSSQILTEIGCLSLASSLTLIEMIFKIREDYLLF